MRIRAPLGADADLNVASAEVSTAGRLGKLEVNTASGDVEIEQVERDARYIESMVGNGPAKGQPQRRAGDMPILATEPGPASLTD